MPERHGRRARAGSERQPFGLRSRFAREGLPLLETTEREDIPRVKEKAARQGPNKRRVRGCGRSARQRAAAFGRVSGAAFCRVERPAKCFARRKPLTRYRGRSAGRLRRQTEAQRRSLSRSPGAGPGANFSASEQLGSPRELINLVNFYVKWRFAESTSRTNSSSICTSTAEHGRA
jgi:hypothetical protein